MRWCTSPTSAAAPGMGPETGEPVSGGPTAYECRVADEAGDLLAGRQLVFSIAGFGPLRPMLNTDDLWCTHRYAICLLRSMDEDFAQIIAGQAALPAIIKAKP